MDSNRRFLPCRAGLEISRHGLAGHHSPEDRPEELAAAINAWADRHGLARR